MFAILDNVLLFSPKKASLELKFEIWGHLLRLHRLTKGFL